MRYEKAYIMMLFSLGEYHLGGLTFHSFYFLAVFPLNKHEYIHCKENK